jgi:hypothetical protein
MTLARVWTRQLYGASGVALLAPATMIAALAVLALSGGFGGLSALGQLLSGPAVPVGATPPDARATPGGATALLPVVPAVTARPGTAAGAPTRVAAGVPAGGRPAAPAPAAGGGGQRVASSGPGATAPPPAAAPPSAPTHPAPTGPPATPAPPSVTAPVAAIVNQVVAVGVSVTSKLPAPVAAIGTGALQSLGQTLNTLLAPGS